VTRPRSFVCEHRFRVAAPIDVVFRLLADPRQLDRLTPPWFGFTAREPVPDALAVGVRVDSRLIWRRIPLRWQSLITVWEPPHLFTYRQTLGPYRDFEHEHRFAEDATGTAVLDRIRYRPPGGRLAARFFVGPDLQRLFAFREQAVRAALEESAAPGPS